MMSRSCVAVVLSVGVLLVGCAEDDTARPAGATSSATPSSVTSSTPDADREAVPRTRVLLRVPEGLVVVPSLPGLARPGVRTSVVVLEQSLGTADPQTVLDQIADGFGTTAATDKGLNLEEARQVTIAGFPGIATTGTQDLGGVTYGKALVVFVAGDTVVFLTGTLEFGDPLAVPDLLAVLTDARWSDTPAPGDLGINLKPTPRFNRHPSSASIVLTLGGDIAPEAPRFIATPSLGANPVPPQQREAFAEYQFKSLPDTPELDTTTEVTIAGLSGYELIGRAGTDRVHYQVVLFTQEGYVVMGGYFRPGTDPDLFADFREMANSLVLT